MELGELTQYPWAGPPITGRKGILRLPIRLSFFAVASVTTTFCRKSPYPAGDLWVWGLFPFLQLKVLLHKVSSLFLFTVPWATLGRLLAEQGKTERGPRECSKENFTKARGI